MNLNESDVSYLAMDAEEGVEVVWNETYFSSLKKLNEQKDKIQKVRWIEKQDVDVNVASTLRCAIAPLKPVVSVCLLVGRPR